MQKDAPTSWTALHTLRFQRKIRYMTRRSSSVRTKPYECGNFPRSVLKGSECRAANFFQLRAVIQNHSETHAHALFSSIASRPYRFWAFVASNVSVSSCMKPDGILESFSSPLNSSFSLSFRLHLRIPLNPASFRASLNVFSS